MAARIGTNLIVDITADVIAHRIVPTNLTETESREVKKSPSATTTRRNLVTLIQGQIGVRNQNLRKPPNHHGEEGTTAAIVAIALGAVTEDRTMIALPQIIWH